LPLLASELVVQFLPEIEVPLEAGHIPTTSGFDPVATGLIGKVEFPHFTQPRN
jgi:hypothetical protein